MNTYFNRQDIKLVMIIILLANKHATDTLDAGECADFCGLRSMNDRRNVKTIFWTGYILKPQKIDFLDTLTCIQG